MRRYMDTFLGLVMLLIISLLASQGLEAVAAGSVPGKKVVVLDAGHGGSDPGKVGTNNALEKEVNLAIAKKVQAKLEEAGVEVLMTREDDGGLYQEGDSNKKIADLNARCRLIEKSGADITVSIHQNSYHDNSISGPQVFYYKDSAEGKKLAEILQASFDGVVEKNTRKAKANDNYYLLLHTKCPLVIVECGFLSNPGEADQLITEEYQEKIAEAVSRGILGYLNAQTT
ncbi:N-acetylmuramoyl-L-alanine amidase [Hominifimenecus sp. rT4P-3]|uniref:N-acetylmuramoyl-L-alanine amidase n=1 Tax=Hominifimenecus sp. rT4P-3 TaxID=3242979 RepID=UPI003DA490CF